MIKSFKFQALLLLILPLIFIGCSRDLIQAENSLEGDWTVVAITSYYGDFDRNSFNATETVLDSGMLGSFNFSEGVVDYSFSRNDSSFAGSSNWTLESEKVNAGFTRVLEFTLDIEDNFLFEVEFENQTKNAEKEATNVRFRENATGPSELLIELTLEKN